MTKLSNNRIYYLVVRLKIKIKKYIFDFSNKTKSITNITSNGEKNLKSDTRERESLA